MYRLMQPSEEAAVVALWQAERGDSAAFAKTALEQFAGVENVYVAEENGRLEAAALAVPVTLRGRSGSYLYGLCGKGELLLAGLVDYLCAQQKLRGAGFTVQLLLPQQEVQIEADVMYLKRVLDNLFDNIRKYADPAKPVAIAALIEDGALHICLSNSVNPASGRIESNKIGLRTCAKIMTQMAGGFRRYTENGKFTAEVILPIQAETMPTE